MPKTIFVALILCVIYAICPKSAYAASQGVVAKRISGCDYFMVNATGGYAVLEWYGGHDPDSGDVLIGKFETYGMHEIVDDTADETINVWTEDYALSRTRALEILVGKCGD
ncbi:MAG: hypothetical protein WBW77_07945 [Candidatus Sulfotelmatobacter sp.]